MSKSALALFITISLCVLSLAQNEVAKNEVAKNEVATSKIHLSSLEEIGEEFKNVPCKNKERQDFVKALFEKMGAKPADIGIDVYKKTENVSIVIPAKADNYEKIVIGAHYDKVSAGCGAIDNWTGIVALAHIYRTFKDYKPNKTLVFVAFDREEEGLLGSKAMVDAIPKEKIQEYCSMVNIDALGLTTPQVFETASSKVLIPLVKELADSMNIPFSVMGDPRGTSDSYSFVRKKIPGVTISGLSNNWPDYLHTKKDQAANVNPQSVYLGYRLATALINKLDEVECNIYTMNKKQK